MSKENNTEKTVRQFIEPLFAETPYSIYDIEYCKEGSEWYLRIYIDKDGGIDLDDCEAVTDLINDPLDELDPIKDAYYLEVSSPGIERHLKTAEHYNAALNEKVRIKTYSKVENKKEWVGILTAVTEEGVTLDAEGKEINIPFEMIAKANISVF